MKRSLAITSVVAVAALVAVSVGGVAKSPASAPVTSAGHRYSTQMVAVAGAMAPVVTITDHQDQKLYIYTPAKDALELRNSVDLTKTGQAIIEMQRAPNPTTRPVDRGQ